MIRFNTLARTALLGLALLAAPMARADDDIDPVLKDKLTSELTAQGYDVRKMEAEDGMIEVYAVKDGAAWELYFDKDGKLVKSCNDGSCEGSDGDND